jgi:hypothetical protein
MKKVAIAITSMLSAQQSFAQCAMCTKTASDLNDNSAAALNNGIIYLACIPLMLLIGAGVLWYRYNKGKL